MKNRTLFKKIFDVSYLVVAVLATAMTFLDHVSIFGGDGRPPALFFTSWTVWTTFFAILTPLFLRKGENYIKFVALLMNIATFIVSAFVLPDKIWTAGYWLPGSIMKHFLLPIFTFVNFAAFIPAGSIKTSMPFSAIFPPLSYWIILTIRIELKRSTAPIPQELWNLYYPYGFTNLDNGHTLFSLCRLLLIILVSLILIGILLQKAKSTKNDEALLSGNEVK